MTLLITMGALIAAVAGRAALLDPQTIARAVAVAAKVASKPGYKVGDLAAWAALVGTARNPAVRRGQGWQSATPAAVRCGASSHRD